jgi:signal transduction histidine kinase/CHASE3 domain sensor protein
MNLKAVFTSSFFLKNIFAVSLIVLIFISGVSYRHAVTLTESADLITHSYEVRVELEQLSSYLIEAESGQRGYILSRDSAFLLPLLVSSEQIGKTLNTLERMIGDNPRQKGNLDSLRGLMIQRFDYFYGTLEQATRKPYNEAKFNKSLRNGARIMNQINNQINNMIRLEMVYLKERQQKYEDEISFTPVFTLTLFFFCLIVFIVSYFKINQDLLRLKISNEQLIITTESFKHAEEIGNFSSWQWDLESSILTYSDNQYRLLGCKPQSFKPSIKKFLEFVHPNDIHLIIESNEEAANDTASSSSALYRIIRKDGEMRYFKSIVKVLTDTRGKKTLIGINSDVTEQHLSNISLEERNRDLEQSNKELASFNHVASHDLQEPLRKIQTFISRISEKEIPTMSPTAQDYFGKIHAAASRMRRLIDDLLLFSSATKTEKVFEKTDLTILLENAKQELAQVIEEKHAVIESVPLPVLNVIPFQIQQLFINLIGNSLKYSKPDTKPYIKIDCEKVIARDYPMLRADTNRKYYKISFEDNGLGFEQEYAESIFILFHRLHHITEYKGTGIGLAICKKIVENHAGVIIANGNPGIGAIFTVFLPE